MTPLEYLRTLLRTFPEIAAQSGYSVPYLQWSFLRGYIRRRVWLGEFRSLRLYECSRPRFDEYLIYAESERISDRLNAGSTKAETDRFDDKRLFNETFRDFVRRDWLYLPRTKEDELRAFLEKHEYVFRKSCRGGRGSGIERLPSAGIDVPEFLSRHREDDCLLEAAIVQHPAMAEVNPASVNTVRLIAARHGDRVALIGAGLRTGGGDQFVDNFHHGGTAYPLDLETGVVTGPGIDLDGNPVLCSPATGKVMPGFRVPCWDELLRAVKAAAVVVPNIGYVGWDAAVTPEGVELVEGNVNYPGNTVIQLDGPGARKRLLDFCREAGVPAR